MSLATKLGSAVRRTRQLKNLTTKALANSAGVSRSTLEKLEAGEPSVSIANAQRILDALQLNVAELLAYDSTLSVALVRKRVSTAKSKLHSTPSGSVVNLTAALSPSTGFSLANREREYDAVCGVKTLLSGKGPLDLYVKDTRATYADVAALLATLIPAGTEAKEVLRRVARENNGVVARAVNYFSPQRLLSMARSQQLVTGKEVALIEQSHG